MLVRKRPTPGTPIAKSASFFSANSLTCRGVMICSASCLRSSGLSGCMSSALSSPLTRTVGARPTLSRRSDPPRCTICAIACLKLNCCPPEAGAAAGAGVVGSAIGVHAEEGLPELDGLRVFDQHLADDPRDLGLDLVHDLHRLDDADRLARRHAAA